MKKNIFILTILLLLAFAYTALTNHYSKPDIHIQKIEPSNIVKLDKPFKDFFWFDLNGKKIHISDIKDKVIILNFWATWCPPCIIEFPEMVRLAKKMPEKTVFVFLSIDDDKKIVKNFLNKNIKDLPLKNVYVGMDSKMDISSSIFDTKKVPETYIIIPPRTIKGKIIGGDFNWGGSEIIDEINRLYSDLK